MEDTNYMKCREQISEQSKICQECEKSKDKGTNEEYNSEANEISNYIYFRNIPTLTIEGRDSYAHDAEIKFVGHELLVTNAQGKRIKIEFNILSAIKIDVNNLRIEITGGEELANDFIGTHKFLCFAKRAEQVQEIIQYYEEYQKIWERFLNEDLVISGRIMKIPCAWANGRNCSIVCDGHKILIYNGNDSERLYLDEALPVIVTNSRDLNNSYKITLKTEYADTPYISFSILNQNWISRIENYYKAINTEQENKLITNIRAFSDYSVIERFISINQELVLDINCWVKFFEIVGNTKEGQIFPEVKGLQQHHTNIKEPKAYTTPFVFWNQFNKLHQYMRDTFTTLYMAHSNHLFITWSILKRGLGKYFNHIWSMNHGQLQDECNYDEYILQIYDDSIGPKDWMVLSLAILDKLPSERVDMLMLAYIVKEQFAKASQQKQYQDFVDKIKKDSCTDSKQKDIVDIDLMSGVEFEKYIAKIFESMGYHTTLTPATGDQGIDIIAQKKDIKIGIQTKCYSSTVGNFAVQEAVAGKLYYNLDKVMVITNNYFTPAAKQLAQVNNVILWDRAILQEKLI